ncbi:hypothetical protein DPSP01_010982 [Paraphaeosphaeria sporulosa]
MKFFTPILLCAFAAIATARSCVPGSFNPECPPLTGAKRSLGLTTKAREFLHIRAAELPQAKE